MLNRSLDHLQHINPGRLKTTTPIPQLDHYQRLLSSEKPTRMTAPALSSRVFIEQHLSSHLSEENANVPAINAAIRKQVLRGCIDSPATLYHSQDTSVDAHSDSRPTFVNVSSRSGTLDTLNPANSRSWFQHTMEIDNAPGSSSNRWLRNDHAEIISSGRPTTSHTVSPVALAKEWAENAEKYLPGISLDDGRTDRTKKDMDLHKIQEKAKELELMMQQFVKERNMQHHSILRTSNESARARMAANSKLAWMLGENPADPKTTDRSRSPPDTTERISYSPRNVIKGHDISCGRSPRKSRSAGALDDEGHARMIYDILKPDTMIEHQPLVQSSFHCTFCRKRFHSHVEWLKHERTIHMPEGLWICCPRTGEFPKKCPFCEKGHPSPAHLADHIYLSCQEKPLTERTFKQKDRFLQHVSLVHRMNPEQKPARLTELEHAWRQRLPPPLERQALHCGFCGELFATYEERTIHVGHHFTEGTDMMSWWKDRAGHESHSPDADKLTNPQASRTPLCIEHSLTLTRRLSQQCIYCERTFENLAMARTLHATCTMWSCSFLPGLQYTIYPDKSRLQREALCCYCNDTLSKTTNGKVDGALLEKHMAQHNFRTCKQTLFFSGQRFHQHLQDSHRSLHGSTLFAGWTLLLRSSRKDVPSIFQQIDKKSNRHHAKTNSDLGGGKHKSNKIQQESEEDQSRYDDAMPMNFMELTETPQRMDLRKLRRKQSAVTISKQSEEEEARPPPQLFARSMINEFASESANLSVPFRLKPEKCVASSTASGAPVCPSSTLR